jgi:hypothetical protein
LDYFSPDYVTARNRFREAVRREAGRLEVLAIDGKGPQGENLSIDIAWFGAAAPNRALLLSSGLHGVEGFAGSAIQLQLLDRLPELPAGTAIVIAHILNPYGMSWLRRVNASNVDLNRNCLPDDKYGGAPPAYARLESFLNPQSPPASDFFALKAALLILRYGMSSLKQSVVGGQYQYPRGLFFGGRRLEQEIERYQEFVRTRLATAEQLIVIDVHTGIGKYGEASLLVDAKEHARLRPIFGERITALEPDQGPAYKVRGGLPSIFGVLPNTETTFIGQEFGTYSPIRVLHALREENRWHHFGNGGLEQPTKQALKTTFCPADYTWRQSVLAQGHALVNHAFAVVCSAPTGSKK